MTIHCALLAMTQIVVRAYNSPPLALSSLLPFPFTTYGFMLFNSPPLALSSLLPLHMAQMIENAFHASLIIEWRKRSGRIEDIQEGCSHTCQIRFV